MERRWPVRRRAVLQERGAQVRAAATPNELAQKCVAPTTSTVGSAECSWADSNPLLTVGPVVLTRHGKGVAVVLSLAADEELEASAVREDLRAAVAAAEEQYESGDVVSNEQMMERLDQWASGE